MMLDVMGGDNGLFDILCLVLFVFGYLFVLFDLLWCYYGFVVVLFVVVFWLLLCVLCLVFGWMLFVICDNEVCVVVVGYDVKCFKFVVFVILGVVMGFVGVLYVLMMGIVLLLNIDYYMSEMIFVMMVIGGMGNLFVLVFGVVFYVLFVDWLLMLWLCWLLLFGFVLIVVSLFM